MLGVEMTSELPKAILEFSETARNSALVKSAMVLPSECVHYHISGKNLNPKAGGWEAAQGVYVLASDRGHELGFTGGFIVGEPNADWWRARMVSSDSDLGNKRAKHLIVARFDNMGNVDTTVIILLGTELKKNGMLDVKIFSPTVDGGFPMNKFAEIQDLAGIVGNIMAIDVPRVVEWY
jgi:hypothetical protein